MSKKAFYDRTLDKTDDPYDWLSQDFEKIEQHIQEKKGSIDQAITQLAKRQTKTGSNYLTLKNYLISFIDVEIGNLLMWIEHEANKEKCLIPLYFSNRLEYKCKIENAITILQAEKEKVRIEIEQLDELEKQFQTILPKQKEP